MKRVCIAILLSVSACAALEVRQLQGEIHSDMPVDFSWLTVRLELPSARDAADSSNVSVTGEFDFRNVPEGSYTLRVIDARGNEIVSQALLVGPANPRIEVRLPSHANDRPTGQTMSVARLRHHPTKRAIEDGLRAQKFSESGDYARAATEWKKAVEADPEFSEAHGNLGTQYSRLGRPAEAAAEFERAIALDPSTAQHQSNLAVALSQLGRIEEAETWARRAVQLEGSNALGHYVLGCVLGFRVAKSAEAIQQLQIASRQIPRAHEKLAQIYHALGKQELAWNEMKEYMEATAPLAPQPAKSWASPLR